ncbi:MAG: hypothetical protein ABI543_04295 [Ignavibacteria bacterium]
MKTCKILLLLIFGMTMAGYSQSNRKMYGITIDGINNINSIFQTIAGHRCRMTTRIVFDEWIPASDYTAAVNKLDSVTIIMGELLDSYYVKDYSVAQYRSRTDEYMNTLGTKVDIWEIGNEANGEWLGPSDSVIAKINYAYQKTKALGYRSALTLYYNKNCWERPQNEMFRWVNEKIGSEMKNGLDYVFVSYYEDDCNNYQPNWQQVFDSLHVIFPNSKLGIGECGTTIASRKEEYINRYYTMHITTPKYVGGYFWWYYRQDCVPWTSKPLWGVLDYAIRASMLHDEPLIEDGDGY